MEGGKMRLKKATLLAIIGISYTFVLKTIGTFLPDIFKNLIVAQSIQILSFLASLTIVFFFISFFKDYVEKEQINLKNATVMAIIGSSAVLLLHVKGLLLVFSRYISPYLVRSHYIESIIPWVSSILILFFFIIFYKEMLYEKEVRLKKAILLAIIGSSIAILLRTFILFNYLCLREIRWVFDLSGKAKIIFLPITIFSFIATLYFFLCFYKEQKRGEKL